MRLLFIGLLVLLFSACLDDPDCVVTSTNYVRITMKTMNKDTTKADSTIAVAFWGITASGTDSVFHKSDTVSTVSLPVNPGSMETKFRFSYGAKTDSLILGYTKKTEIISPQCGAFLYYQNLRVISTSFEKVTVINPQLATSVTSNIEIKL